MSESQVEIQPTPNEHLGWTAPDEPRSWWQRFYGGIHARRRRYYRSRQRSLGLPVISVGNLHWGGTGKTPMTATIARHFQSRGDRVAILSRGYGRRGSGPLVVSVGNGPLHPPELAGDEPHLFARTLPGVAVVVDADRHAAGQIARDQLGSTLLLLDDGFSHLALARDLDVLLFPRADPFGRGRLFPSGRLREPMSSVAFADAAILTGGLLSDRRELDPEIGSWLSSSLEPMGFRGPGFVAGIEPTVTDDRGELLAKGRGVLLVTGVGRPKGVELSAEALGLEVVEHLAFSNHHRYPDRSLRKIRRALARRPGACLITTAKDRSKLEGRLGLPIGELSITSQVEPSFFSWLDQRLADRNDRSPATAPTA